MGPTDLAWRGILVTCGAFCVLFGVRFNRHPPKNAPVVSLLFKGGLAQSRQDSGAAIIGWRIQGVRKMPSETTDFVEGASYALLLGLLCWAAIGAAVYGLISV